MAYKCGCGFKSLVSIDFAKHTSTCQYASVPVAFVDHYGASVIPLRRVIPAQAEVDCSEDSCPDPIPSSDHASERRKCIEDDIIIASVMLS